jgi:predicted phage terminase large subunit-like protein
MTAFPLPTRLEQYTPFLQELKGCTERERLERIRILAKTDLFFLLWFVCKREDLWNQWLLDRVREVQASPNGHLDLWPRGYRKSTIITFGLTIFAILNDPEITVGLFSHTRPAAKGFLDWIKRELEGNTLLLQCFPDIFYANPSKESPRWSLDDGLIVKRKTNPKECTVEAYGLVDSMPTGKHYKLRVYDDVAEQKAVSSPDMTKKTLEAIQLSHNLTSDRGVYRFVGTRYSFADPYESLMRQGIVKPRIQTATKDGTEDFSPENCVYLSSEELRDKRREQGPWSFNCQMLMRPQGDATQGFKREWIKDCIGPEKPRHEGLIRYIFVDPANSKKLEADYTAMWVIGFAPDKHYVVLDMVRDRLSLSERADRLLELTHRWSPQAIIYEKYGMMADEVFIKKLMHERQCRCPIKPIGGSLSKEDRIRRLVPLFEQAKIILLPYCNRTIYNGTTTDLVQDFIEQEYTAFPSSQHDDMLDALSRICDEKELGLRWPQSNVQRAQQQSSRPTHTNNGDTKGFWARQREKAAGRNQPQRPAARPQERGIWAGKPGWK